MADYSDFQRDIALTYAHAKFTDYLKDVTDEKRKQKSDAEAFADFLKSGLEISVLYTGGFFKNN